MDNEQELEKEWNDMCMKSCGVAMICPDCGGSSVSFCRCAKSKWMKTKREEIKNRKDIGKINEDKSYGWDAPFKPFPLERSCTICEKVSSAHHEYRPPHADKIKPYCNDCIKILFK